MTTGTDSRVLYALVIAIVGLFIPAGLAVFLVLNQWKANDVATIIGVFTSIVGTLVGAFLGVQVGSAGKDKAEDRASKSEALAARALAALAPETAKTILGPQ